MVAYLRVFLAASVCGYISRPAFAADDALDLSTPEKAFAAYSNSLDKRDYSTLFETYSKRSQDVLVAEAIFSAHFPGRQEAVAIVKKYLDSEKEERLQASVDSSKLKPEEKLDLLISCITDRKRLYVEVITKLDRFPEDRPLISMLRDVKIDGAFARGKATYSSVLSGFESKGGKSVPFRKRSEDEVDIHFVKVDGKWRVMLEQEAKALEAKNREKK